MGILPIYLYGQPELRKKTKPVKRVDAAFRKFVDDMFETMHVANGIGLAANQVGSLDRVLVVEISEADEEKYEGAQESAEGVAKKKYQGTRLVLINPEVIASEGSWTMEEGCLSIPDIRDEVERPETIRVRYKDIEMNDREIEASGLLGRVFLHEIDHLNGVLFIDRLGALKRKLLRGRLNKILKGQVEVNYRVMFAEELAEK